MTVMGVGNHMGWEMFPRPLVHGPAGKWLITATHHQAHHAAYRGHYGLYFRFWDRACGTDIGFGSFAVAADRREPAAAAGRSEAHTAELQPLMRTSYAVFCLRKKMTVR